MEHPRLVGQHHWSFTSSFTLLMIFMDISDTTHPNSAIDSLWLTRLEAVSHSSLRSSHWIKSSFHLYPIFPMMNHCVLFYTHFISDLSSDSSCCSKMELSGIFLWLMSNHLQIQKCCLVIHDSPHVYKEAVLPQRKDNQVLSSAFFSKIINLTVLITTSGLVSKTLQSLNHSDYIIRVCPY